MMDTIAGQTQVLFDDVPTQMPHVRAGKLRILAVTGPKRLAEIPEVPTADESGLSGFFTQTWVGLFAPAGTHKGLIDSVSEAVNAALGKPEIKAQIARLGMEPAGGSPKQFADIIASETKMWAGVVKSAGLKFGN
jgi:tripartite-type tricarboxylate transporter receptor subunit TctC